MSDFKEINILIEEDMNIRVVKKNRAVYDWFMREKIIVERQLKKDTIIFNLKVVLFAAFIVFIFFLIIHFKWIN